MRLSIIPTIAELQKEAGEGKCAFCEEIIPSWKFGKMPPTHCGEVECRKSYHRLYREVRTARFWAMGLNCHGKPPTGKLMGRRAEQ